MAIQATRHEYRIALSQVDRGRDASESIIAAREASETMEHLTLRALAWCLLNEDRLTLGPGLSDPDAADLWSHDLTGRLTTWVECGAVSADKLRKVVNHNAGIAAHVVMDDARRAAELTAELANERLARKGPSPTSWLIDAAFVQALAARDDRRQKWTVTVVGDHFYVEADGEALDGAISRVRLGQS